MKSKTGLKVIVSLVLILPFILFAQDKSKIDKYSQMSLDELMEVEITIASKNKQKVSEAPGIVTVITDTQIKNMGARDLRDVLRCVPGFEIGMRDLGYTSIGVRGIITPNSEKVKILIDDVPINEHLEGSGTVVFADMALDNIKTIEIIRGPGSALYGTNAFVAVINIITKKAKDIDGMKTFLRFGSFKTSELGILFGKKLSDNGLEISGYLNYLYTDGASRSIEQDTISNDSTLNPGVSLAGTDNGYTQYGRKKLTASLNLTYKDLYFKGYFIDSRKKHAHAYLGMVALGNRPHPQQLQGMLGYKLKLLDKKLEIEPRFYMLQYKVSNLWHLAPPGFREFDPKINDVRFYPNGKYELNPATQRMTGLDCKISYDLFNNNNLIAGFSFERNKFIGHEIKNNFLENDLDQFHLIGGEKPPEGIMTKNPITRTIASAYLQDQWHITDKIGITAGVRLDHYSDAGSTVNPRIALVLKPFKKTTLKALYGQAFRDPTFSENYVNVLDGFIRGNEENVPETIRTAELELGYKFSKKLQVRINYFHNSINKLIDLRPSADGSYLEYGNIPAETVVQGIEAELKAVFGQNTNNYCFLNYAYQDGENKETGYPVTGMANHFFNAGVNYELSRYFNLNITTNMVGPRKKGGEDKWEDLKGYTLVNVTLIGKKILKNLELVVSVHNLLDSDHRVPDTSGFFPNHYPLEGRSFLIGLNYEL